MRSKEKIKRLKKWLIDLDETQDQIATTCGVSQELISMTISGKRTNRKVIDYFLSKGCPRDLLD
jgi:predicted transcriptional regulator